MTAGAALLADSTTRRQQVQASLARTGRIVPPVSWTASSRSPAQTNQLRMFRDLADHVAHGPDAAADVTGLEPAYATVLRDGVEHVIPVLIQSTEKE